MSTTASIIGATTTLGYGAVSMTPTYTLLGEVKDVKAPPVKIDTYEATHYNSPNMWKEYLIGWKDGGEVPVECNYLHASATALIALFGVAQAWQITLPDTHTWSFNGYINGYDGDIPNKGVCDLKLKIKVTSQPVYA
jgi:hypothetical protein